MRLAEGGAGAGGLLSLDGQQELVVLLSRVAAGDRGAFQVLYERTSAKLFASVCRILGNRAAAEDAVQEAYFKIWNRAGDFDGVLGTPIAWMTATPRSMQHGAAPKEFRRRRPRSIPT
jgi:RNA polymerase sigma-70 factor, ECF subfamily